MGDGPVRARALDQVGCYKCVGGCLLRGPSSCGTDEVSICIGGEVSVAWVDVYHRLAEASYHLVTGEVTASQVNPLLAGM